MGANTAGADANTVYENGRSRKPSRFLKFLYTFQGLFLIVMPLVVSFLPGVGGKKGWMAAWGILFLTPIMFVGQLIIWIATFIKAQRAQVRTMGSFVGSFLCAYYIAGILYGAGMYETDDSQDYPSLLNHLGVPTSISYMISLWSLAIGAICLALATLASLVDRPEKVAASFENSPPAI